jgi:hypothetical protein
VRTAGSAAGPEGRVEQQLAVAAARDAIVDEEVDHDIPRVLGAEADDFPEADVATHVPADAIGWPFAIEALVLNEALGADLADMVRGGTAKERLVLQLGRRLSGSKGADRFPYRCGTFHGPAGHLLGQSQELAVVVAQARFQMLGVCGGVGTHGVDFIQ